MISATTDDQYERIKGDLVGYGLTYDRLMEDVLDHVCCLVEEHMAEGADFESSYDLVLQSIGEKRIRELQHEALLNLDKKFQRMKRITYLSGLTGSILTLFGVFFKMMHWPAASILIALGFILVGLVFLPLYFTLSYREQVEKPHVAYPIVGYITIFLILTGAVFKIMHWPGAGILLYVSIGVLAIVFIPLFVVRIFKKSPDRKINTPYVVMLLIGISIIALLTRVNISKNHIDSFTALSLENIDAVEQIESRIQSRLAVLPDSLRTDDLTRIVQQSETLDRMIREMQGGLLERVDQPGVPIDQVSGRDFRNAARDAILDNGLGARFLEESGSFRKLLLASVDDPVISGQISYLLQYAGENPGVRWNVIEDENVYEPLILYYFDLTGFSRRVAFCTYLAVEELLER
jgi:uncharacterized membrane protein